MAAVAACLVACTVAQAQPLANKRPIVFVWRQDSEDANRREAAGSGFILGPGGHILTAAHVARVVPGQRLTVSIATKEAPPVSVDMRDVDCDALQDFCFLRINEDAVAERGLSEFYPLACYMPAAGERIRAAGFFAGADPNTGVVVTPGEVTGAAVTGGFLPTDVTMEQGMSGGPIFDEAGRVVGLVKGGTAQFAFIQPLQRASSGLLERGFPCPVVRGPPPPQAEGDEAGRAAVLREIDELKALQASIREALSSKELQLIPALDLYRLDPNAGNWAAVRMAAEGDQVRVRTAIDGSIAFFAKYDSGGSEASASALDDALDAAGIDPASRPDTRRLRSIIGSLTGRSGALSQILGEAVPPGPERARDYRLAMEDFFDTIKRDLDGLIRDYTDWLQQA